MSKCCRRIIAVMTVIVMILVQSGCKSNSNDNFSLSIPQDFPASVGGATIKSCPQRVVSLSPMITGVIYSLGSNSQLCAVSDLCDYPDIKDDMPRVGTYASPDIEKIKSLGCDLLLTQTQLSSDNTEKLKSAGITVAVVNAPTDYNKAADFYRNIAVAVSGMHSGKLNAENTFSRINKSLESVTANYDVSAKKRAVLILAYGDAAAKGDTLEGQIFAFSGAENILKNSKSYSFDSKYIASQNPQFIFCCPQDVEKIKSDADLKTTDAVKNDKVLTVDVSQIQNISDEMTKCVEQICGSMYNYVEKK